MMACVACGVRPATYDDRFCSTECGWVSVFGGLALRARREEVYRELELHRFQGSRVRRRSPRP